MRLERCYQIFHRLMRSFTVRLCLPFLLISALNAQMTYTVTNTDDSGPGSLRQAIIDANTNVSATPDSIVFDIEDEEQEKMEEVSFLISVTSALPGIIDPVIIDGSTQPGNEDVCATSIEERPVYKVILDGGGGAYNGLRIVNDGSGSTIRGLNIRDFGLNGIEIAESINNTISCNFIGTSEDGESSDGNGRNGISLSPANNTVIGTDGDGNDDAYEGNLISGNGWHGISTNEVSGTTIAGNFIGTDLFGESDLGNGYHGVLMGTANINVVGTNGDGTSDALEGNLISGNSWTGVRLADSRNITVAGNKIGTDLDGASAIANSQHGVQISEDQGGSTIGTNADETSDILEKNLISGNTLNGVVINSDGIDNVIAGNYIGTDISGASALGNGENGILIEGDAFDNTIGGSDGISGNIIAHNAEDGITLEDDETLGNMILGNSIFENGQLGIDLGNDGVTPNDPGDIDEGPNNLQNYPLLTSTAVSDGEVTISGTLNSAANAAFTISFFSNSACDDSEHGEGETFLGESLIETDSNGDAEFEITLSATLSDTVVTATATDEDGNTSEFSQCFFTGEDLIYSGNTPVTTGGELGNNVNNITVDNSGGVTLSKSIGVGDSVKVLDGDFDLNGNVIALSDTAEMKETPGNTVKGESGKITTTRELNDLSGGENVGGMGLGLQTLKELAETIIDRAHKSQEITPNNFGIERYFDVEPENNGDLNVEVMFNYDESELNAIPEEDLVMYKSEDAANSKMFSKAGGNQIRAELAAWTYLGGTKNATANAVCKGDVDDFSRFTLGQAFIFLADEQIRIKGLTSGEGDMFSNDDIRFDAGRSGTHSGNLTAIDQIVLKKDVTVEGDAIAGGKITVDKKSEITGGVTANEDFPELGIFEDSFSAGGPDVESSDNENIVLAPGSYGKVKMRKRSTLQLSTGTYFMERLELGKEVSFSLDVSAGPVIINITDNLDFNKAVEMSITPGGQDASTEVYITTLQNGKVKLRNDSFIMGWINAPNAEISFSQGCRFKGAAVGRRITVEKEVVYIPHSSNSVLSKGRVSLLADADIIEQRSTGVITEYELKPNYPNPFNPSTTIEFAVPEPATVTLNIYNSLGQLVRQLVAENYNAGWHAVKWDGRNDQNAIVASGVYLYVFRANDFVSKGKLIMMK